MPRGFKGTINLDIRESRQWDMFLPSRRLDRQDEKRGRPPRSTCLDYRYRRQIRELK